MIIYNVTIKLDWRIHDAWLRWMKEEHLPAMLETGCFMKAQLVRILEVDDEEGPTYAAQFYAVDKDQYDRYIGEFATGMRAVSMNKWGDMFVAFRSVMEIVN